MITFARQIRIEYMNYEEMLRAKSDGKQNKAMQPLGEYYRQQVDGKYRGFLDIRRELDDNVLFGGLLTTECARNQTLSNNHQIHFTAKKRGTDVTKLELEMGSYQTFEQLLTDTPAVVAEKGFVDNTIRTLVQFTTYLHSQGIYHVCYSPRTVFARKGDNAVMLLSHGSFYFDLRDQQALYRGFEDYVAPEVMSHGTIDQRCDVYGIGKFLEDLFKVAEMPLEYKQIVKKAVSASPEDRYASPEDMFKAMQTKRNAYRSLLGLIAAAGIALLCVGIYFDMFPESSPIEFVKPVPRQATDDLLDDGFDPAEMGIVSADSLSEEDLVTQREHEAKAEEIFRKQYEKEADRILSKIYNSNRMNVSEKKFMAESKETIEELMKAQEDLAASSIISPDRAQLIASEIIDRITDEKKKAIGTTSVPGLQPSKEEE